MDVNKVVELAKAVEKAKAKVASVGEKTHARLEKMEEAARVKMHEAHQALEDAEKAFKDAVSA